MRIPTATIEHYIHSTIVGERLKKKEFCIDFVQFLTASIQADKRPYSFEQHRPLLEIAQRLPQLKEVWVLKGAQVGLSTLAVGLLGHYMKGELGHLARLFREDHL